MNQEFLDQLIVLLDDFANTYEDRDFLKMYRARLAILEHIDTMNPDYVPDIVAKAYHAWIAAPSTDINASSPELKSLTNLIGMHLRRLE